MKKFISVLIAILFIACLTIWIMITSTGTFFTAKNIEKEMIRLNFSVITSAPSTPENKQINDTIDEIYTILEEYSIPKEVTEDILDSHFTKQLLGGMAGNITEYLLTGKETKVLTEKDLNILVDQNMDTILEKSEVKISNKQKEDLTRYIKKNTGEIVNILPSAKEVANEFPKNIIDTIRTIFSRTTKMLFGILAIVFAFILIVLNRKKGKWALYTSISTLITGLGIAVFAFIITPVLSIAMESEGGAIIQIIDAFMDTFQKKLIAIGLLLALASIVTLIIYKIYRLNKDKKKS